MEQEKLAQQLQVLVFLQQWALLALVGELGQQALLQAQVLLHQHYQR
jgi:hypothetical protein